MALGASARPATTKATTICRPKRGTVGNGEPLAGESPSIRGWVLSRSPFGLHVSRVTGNVRARQRPLRLNSAESREL